MIPELEHIASAWKGHGLFATELVKHFKPEVIVDLGVDYGYSTFAFAMPNIGMVYGIDWFKGDEQTGDRDTEAEVRAELARLNLPNVELIKGEFTEVYKTWKPKIDILHIDGRHNYEFVKRDFEMWRNKVKGNGIILMHDTTSFPEMVGRFFNEIDMPKHNLEHSAGLGIVCYTEEMLAEVMKLT
jgi:predicted O-methyltransferase YrrM